MRKREGVKEGGSEEERGSEGGKEGEKGREGGRGRERERRREGGRVAVLWYHFRVNTSFVQFYTRPQPL